METQDLNNEPILPPGPRWSPDHLRLHRHLRHHPELLPAGAPLLLAISGGQDSMALLALLRDLQRLHHWSLHLWHGDHRWRPESGQVAAELAGWCSDQGLKLHVSAWLRPLAATSEADARHWRYGQLAEQARSLGVGHVVTAHTASDRAETLLLHLARGSHRRGLASLRSLRPLSTDISEPIALARPLLPFSRADTARLCQQLKLPLWQDPSNTDRRYSRNRIRSEVVPVLEELHPGAAQRISALAERLVEEVESSNELVNLALQTLKTVASHGAAPGLQRQELGGLAVANQRQLLHHWLEQGTSLSLPARQLEELLRRLQPGHPPGQADLGAGWQLRWDRCTLWQHPPAAQLPQ
jgi:tRNA(Ile)-lysidine synthase